MKTVTFSPIKDGVALKPEQYFEKYPELSEREEVNNLRAIEVMWCWFYGHPDSPYCKMKHDKRCAETTKIVFDTINKNFYEPKQIELLRDGLIPHNWYKAIEFFKGINTGLRVDAKNMYVKMYEEYKEILDGGKNNFIKDDGSYDFKEMVSTLKMIKAEMADLVNEIERGFGTSTINYKGSEENEGQYYCEMYIKNKK